MSLYLPLMWDCNVQQMLHLSMLLSGGHPEILCDTFQHFHPGHRSHISLWKDQDKVFLANFQKKVKISLIPLKKKSNSLTHLSQSNIELISFNLNNFYNINLFLLTPFKDNKQVINCIFVAIKCFDTVTDKMKKNSKRNDTQNPYETFGHNWQAKKERKDTLNFL